MFVMIIPLLTMICLLSFIFEFLFLVSGQFFSFWMIPWAVWFLLLMCACFYIFLLLLLFFFLSLFVSIAVVLQFLFVSVDSICCILFGSRKWYMNRSLVLFDLFCFLVLFFGWYDYLFDIDIWNWSIRNTLVCCILSERVCVCVVVVCCGAFLPLKKFVVCDLGASTM